MHAPHVMVEDNENTHEDAYLQPSQQTLNKLEQYDGESMPSLKVKSKSQSE
jgi:hypothetical protein